MNIYMNACVISHLLHSAKVKSFPNHSLVQSSICSVIELIKQCHCHGAGYRKTNCISYLMI